jgi:hypothetical protein
VAACSNCAKLLGPERKLRKLRRTAANCCKLRRTGGAIILGVLPAMCQPKFFFSEYSRNMVQVSSFKSQVPASHRFHATHRFHARVPRYLALPSRPPTPRAAPASSLEQIAQHRLQRGRLLHDFALQASPGECQSAQASRGGGSVTNQHVRVVRYERCVVGGNGERSGGACGQHGAASA